MQQPIKIPTFTYGTYRSADGSTAKFTDDFMRTLVRNTNFVIASKALKPPVAYDHFAFNVRDTDAHGHLAGAEFTNGVLYTNLAQPSDKLTSDVRTGRRLTVSGEYHPDFEFTDPSGKKVKVGPTIVGLAILGRNRPALKNPALVPLSELGFSEDTPPTDAYFAREELRKAGFVSQTLDEGIHAFSEIDVDPRAFSEEENPMTKEEIQAMIDAQVNPLKAENAALKAQVTAFSETSARSSDTLAFCEKVNEKNTRLTSINIDNLTDLLNDPEVTTNLRTKIKRFAEGLSPVVVPGGTAGKKTKKAGESDDEGADEPAAVEKLREKHLAAFSEPANQQAIMSAVEATEADPSYLPDDLQKAFSEASGDVMAQKDVLGKYVKRRDSGDAAAN